MKIDAINHLSLLSKASSAFIKLMKLIIHLRTADGCSWDRQQTPLSVTAYILEEVYEMINAIENKQPKEVCIELGDLLFQLLFIIQLYFELGYFGLSEVIEQVEVKMYRRHPHIFRQGGFLDDKDLYKLWNKIKNEEKNKINKEGDKIYLKENMLNNMPLTAPALIQAQRLGQQAKWLYFDWETSKQIFTKVIEELVEIENAVTPFCCKQELGDLLFVIAQWARHQGLNAEAALRWANIKFITRFRCIEELALERSIDLKELTFEEWNKLWQEVKVHE